MGTTGSGAILVAPGKYMLSASAGNRHCCSFDQWVPGKQYQLKEQNLQAFDTFFLDRCSMSLTEIALT